MNKKYLITGITGHAAPHLANYLIGKGDKVSGLIRGSNGREQDIRDVVPDKNFSKIDFLYGDLGIKEDMDKIFKENKFNGVYHLGAQSHPPTSFIDPEGTYKTNYLGTKNIIDGIKKYQRDCVLMACSTSEVYGVVPKEKQPMDENIPIRPINPYGLSKALMDTYVLGCANIKADPFNLKAFTTRAFSHCSTRRGNKFSISSDAYQLIRIKKGLQKPTISVGTLSSKRAVMDSRDCVRAYSMLMEKALKGDERVIGEAFNVGGDELFTMRELLDHQLKITGLEDRVTEWVNPKFVRKIDIPTQIPNSDKLRNLTGWKPEISIVEKTLPDLLNYWDEKIFRLNYWGEKE